MRCELLFHCGGAHSARVATYCDHSVAVDMASLRDPDALQRALKIQNWVLAIATPSGVTPVKFDPMCLECAERIMPEAVRAMRNIEPKRPTQ